jgi:hypothetical protein
LYLENAEPSEAFRSAIQKSIEVCMPEKCTHTYQASVQNNSRIYVCSCVSFEDLKGEIFNTITEPMKDSGVIDAPMLHSRINFFPFSMKDADVETVKIMNDITEAERSHGGLPLASIQTGVFLSHKRSSGQGMTGRIFEVVI